MVANSKRLIEQTCPKVMIRQDQRKRERPFTRNFAVGEMTLLLVNMNVFLIV